MERKLGISLYPEHSTPQRDMEYLTKAAKYGFNRVFTCLLSVDRPKEEIIKEFKTIIGHAKGLDMEVILDVSPTVFDKLGISYDNLQFFADLGADGIRLDEGFNGLKEAKLTCNPYGLKIELNASNDVDYLDNILSHQADKTKLLGCHNFYPQRFTGLPYDYFIQCSKRFKKHGLRTAAFVTSQTAAIGPWDINDGLCTLEEHRHLPIDVQAKHLWATGVIDDVIIGNAYASEKELQLLGRLNRTMLELKLEFAQDAATVEKQAALAEVHIRRGDVTEYMIRSTEVRKKYKAEDFPIRTSAQQEKGLVMIGNNSFGKYKGELQVILKAMPLDERKNVVGKIVEEELFLLDYVKAWTPFKLTERSEDE